MWPAASSPRAERSWWARPAPALAQNLAARRSSGLDAETGRIAWRVNTIAQPGEPGGESWNGIPIEKRSGASVWTTGSYEPATGLAFFGTGNTYDTGPLLPPSSRPGVTNDALYTNTTLAIDPETGKIVWHFQHHRRELWDLDWAFERQIVELPVRGQMRKVVVTAGKIGIYDAVEAATGRFVFSIDLGLQNIVTGIDPETGEKEIDASRIPDDRSVKLVCPHGAGVKNYPPASYNPASKVVIRAAHRSVHGRLSHSRRCRTRRPLVGRELGNSSASERATGSTDVSRRSISRRARPSG